MPFLIFQRDHLRSTLGIICSSGSFAVQFEDHFQSGDHLWLGIICGTVQTLQNDLTDKDILPFQLFLTNHNQAFQ